MCACVRVGFVKIDDMIYGMPDARCTDAVLIAIPFCARNTRTRQTISRNPSPIISPHHIIFYTL